MFTIEYSPKALEDLWILYDYISENWSEVKGKEILEKLTKTIRSLEKFPMLGSKVSKIIDVNTEYRLIFNEKNYIFYRIEDNRILIIRILNEKQDYLKILFDEN